MSAIRMARKHHYGIEIDLQLSADGRAMVFHDYTLERMTQVTGKISTKSAEKLRKLRLGLGKDTIPTLSQVIKSVAGCVPILIEIKPQNSNLMYSNGLLEKAIACDLKNYSGPVAVMSFSPAVIKYMANLSPEIPRGLTTDSFLKKDWPNLEDKQLDLLRSFSSYNELGCSFVSHYHKELSRNLVSRLRAMDAKILCWTIRSHTEAQKAYCHADNITFEGFTPSKK